MFLHGQGFDGHACVGESGRTTDYLWFGPSRAPTQCSQPAINNESKSGYESFRKLEARRQRMVRRLCSSPPPAVAEVVTWTLALFCRAPGSEAQHADVRKAHGSVAPSCRSYPTISSANFVCADGFTVRAASLIYNQICPPALNEAHSTGPL
jgi:hypothetical protein